MIWPNPDFDLGLPTKANIGGWCAPHGNVACILGEVAHRVFCTVRPGLKRSNCDWLPECALSVDFGEGRLPRIGRDFRPCHRLYYGSGAYPDGSGM